MPQNFNKFFSTLDPELSRPAPLDFTDFLNRVKVQRGEEDLLPSEDPSQNASFAPPVRDMAMQPEEQLPVPASAMGAQAGLEEAKALTHPKDEPSPLSRLSNLFNSGGASHNYAEDLNRAIEQRDSSINNAQLAQGFGRLGAAIAGTKPIMDDIYEARIKQAEKPIQDVKEREAQEKFDPGSAQSKALREALKIYQINIPEGYSFADIEKAYPVITKAIESEEARQAKKENAKLFAEMRGDVQKDKKAQQDANLLSRYQTRAESHPIVKDAQKSMSAASRIEDLLKIASNEGGQALSALGPQVARLMGEVGVLTESDVTRYVQNPQQAKKLFAQMSKWSQGKLPAADAENIKNIMGIFINKAQQNRDKAYKTVAGQYSRALKIPENDARYMIDPEYQPEGSQEMPKSSGSVANPYNQSNLTDMVTIKQKSTGMVKTLKRDAASKYLSNSDFEEVK